MIRTVALSALAGIALLTPTVSAAAAPQPSQSYIDNCSACHLPNGIGVQGVFPSLAGNRLVKGDPNELVRVILAGRNGMPSFKNDLTDDQLAAIATHIRTKWGNGAKPVTPAFIDQVRKRTNNQRGRGAVLSN